MKKMKKMISFLLTMVMVISMAFGSMAAMEGTLENGSITIENAVEGQTYSVYQILYLESYNADPDKNPETNDGLYVYKANSEWENWLKTQTTYVSFDEQGYVTWVEGADAAEFAKAAQAYAKEKSIEADASKTADSTTVEFTKLNLGYYLVDTTLGTLCSLDTTNPDVTMKEKNEAPEVKKEVQEDSSEEWGETNDADINQTVNYKATITVKPGAENYVLHDKMSDGLTFDGAESVKVQISEVDVDGENYTIITNATDGCTFEVKFDNDYIATLASDTKIVVTYSATLNENAVVGLSGNPNEVKLEYGDKEHSTFTPKSETITYTWDAKVLKYTLKDNVEMPLAGATFTLSKSQDGTNPIKFHALGENVYQVCVDENCTEEHVTEITTDTTGSFAIKGLDADTYYLTETQAPAGYNKVAGAKEIVITGAETGENNEVTYTTVETKVLNQSGTELPSTGGTGTTIFYIVGGILVVAAGVLLVVRKRADMEE